MDILQAVGSASIVRFRKVVPASCADLLAKLDRGEVSSLTLALAPARARQRVASTRRPALPGIIPSTSAFTTTRPLVDECIDAI